MSDLDLSALTEAVQERLTIGGDYNPLDWSLPDVVRAVLEALPQEHATEHQHRPPLDWLSQPVRGPLSEECRQAGCRRVRRAVGPPIPAEDA